MEKIAIVGMGTMGSAIGDLLNSDYEVVGFRSGDSLGDMPTADTVILAVKPQVFLPDEETGGKGLADEMWPYVTEKQRIISIMAGVTTARLCQLLDTPHVVRTMPNTANTLIAWYTNDKSIDDESLRGLFDRWGDSIRLDGEEQFDIFTATAGSGPAFLLSMAEVMCQELERHGFSAEQARQIAGHTLQGAAKMSESGDGFDELIRRIASRGGTTEAGIKSLELNNFSGVARGAVEAARRRSEELGRG